jgi:iron complex transport system substrate-binding protein
LHLFPEHLEASRYHNRMRALAFLLLWTASAGAQVAVRDDYGHDVRLAQPAARIVSLAPHLTELLYAGGAGTRLVGAVEYSDFPPKAKSLPRVGSDARIDLEAVLALRPDLIVAWPNAGSLRAVDRLTELGLPVFRSEPRELEDIPRTLQRLGTLAGTRPQADAAAAAFRNRARALQHRYAGERKVRVFYQIWDRPLLTVNGAHMISKVIGICGGENVFASAPLLVPEVDREAVLNANPDVIVASGSNDAQPLWLQAWRAFPGLAAVQQGQLYAIPADLIQRQTPRILDGAERLCGFLQSARGRS